MSKSSRNIAVAGPVVTCAAATVALPPATMSRDLMLRQYAEVQAAKAATRTAERAAAEATLAASTAAGAAELAALMGYGAFCAAPVPSAAAAPAAPRGSAAKLTAYYNGLVARALAAGMTHLTVNSRVYQIRYRKHNFTGATGANMTGALEAALAH